MFARLILPMSLLLALAGPTSACPGQTGKVIFSEDFADDSGGWADIDPHMQFSDGGLKITAGPKSDPKSIVSDGSLNSTFYAKDGDYCAVFAFPSSPPEADNPDYVSLTVLATDYKNRYQIFVSTNGDVAITRLEDNKSQTLLPWLKVSAVKTDPGAENTLRVVAKNQKLTFSVNGEQIKVLRVPVPDDAKRFGFWTGTLNGPPTDPRVYVVKSYNLTEAP